jgi:hypothetical protein
MAIVLTEESINFNKKRIIRCKVYTAKSAQVIQWRPTYVNHVTLF